MQKKETIMLVILAALLVIFALISLYFNVLQPKGVVSTTPYKPVQEKPIELNNTLKTSVTVLPAPGNQK